MITIVDKATHAATALSGREVSLEGDSIVELPVARAQIKALARQDGDLVITTVDGETIVIHGYFVPGQALHNDLVLNDGVVGDVDKVGNTGGNAGDDTGEAGSGARWLADLDSLGAQTEGVIEPDAENAASIFSVLAVDPAAEQVSSLVVSDGASVQDVMTSAPVETPASELSLPWLPLVFAAAGMATAAGGGSSSVGGNGGRDDGASGHQTPVVPDAPVAPDALPVATLTSFSGLDYLGMEKALPVAKAGDDLVASAARLVFQGAVSAKLGAGQQVQISLDDGSTWQNASVSADGTTWTYDNTASSLTDGSHAVQIRVVDTASAQQGAPISQNVIVDTTPPGETVVITAVTGGAAAGDGLVTGDSALTVSGTLSAPLNAKGGAPESVQVSLDGGVTWHTAVVEGTTWTYDNTANPLASGTYTVEARVMDAAGNVGDLSVRQVVVDTQGIAPTQASTLASIGDDTGASGTDFVTSATDLTLTGTLGAPLADGQQVQFSLDGGQAWQSATVDASGAGWTAAPQPLTDGSYRVETRVYDSNTHLAGSVDSHTVVIDTVKPTETVAIASSSADGITFTGTLSAPLNQAGGSVESLQISFDGGPSVQAQVSDSGWSYANATALGAGLHAVQASVVDLAGNAGPVEKAAVSVSANGVLELSLESILNVASAIGKQVEIPASANVSSVHLTEGKGTGETQWQETGTTAIHGVDYVVYHNAKATDTIADLLVQAGISVV